MDASLLTTAKFWADPAPFAAGGFPGGVPDIAELQGHVLFETSGSSGEPKWIALSKNALLASAEAVNRHLEVARQSVWGLALPPRHVGGFGVAARAFASGCAFREFGRRWNAPAFAGWLAENDVTHASLVPAQVHDLVAADVHAPSSLRAIVVGGGRLDAGTGRAARDLGWPVLASYGMTEAGSQIATQGLEELEDIYRPSPIPLLPIWRAETTKDQKLRITGPALFSGTIVRDGERWVFKDRGGQWHETDDRALLENGRLIPLGRADARVKVLGELVDLDLIEMELTYLSGGMLSPGSFAVVAVPDARSGHALVPVFDASVRVTVIAAVLADYEEKAPGLRKLRPPVVLDMFPRGSLGKPRRAEIEALIGLRNNP